jgi:hypothetical protein
LVEGKIMSPVADIDPYVFLYLVTCQAFQNTIHIGTSVVEHLANLF